MIYRSLIAQALDTDDAATVALVEDLMRTERTSLDYLSRDEFAALAQEAAADAVVLHRAGQLADYCDVLNLTLPAWATTTRSM